MGYATLVAPCFVCGKLFSGNPRRVPSYQNQPICRDCIEKVNKRRAETGQPLWPVPPDAYEAVDEAEL
jgi:hypothetical protein